MTEARIYLNALIEIFKIEKKDFLGFAISKDNPLQYHHIIFKKDGGKTTLANGAPLTAKAHNLFHTIAREDYIISKKLTKEFKKLNESRIPPDKEYYKIVAYILNEYRVKKNKTKKEYIRNRVK